MHLVATPDPSELTRRLIGGFPGECAELVEGDRRFCIVRPVLVGRQPGRFLSPILYSQAVPRSATTINGPCTSTRRFEWVILSLPAPGVRPTRVAGVRG